MKTFRETSQWIRDYVNEPKHQQRFLSVRFSWNQLCSAMDVIDDVDIALEAYLTGDFPNDAGEKYLRTYGVLQALFIQQDALRHLLQIVRPSMRIELSDVLKEVRDLRSMSIGHPTEYTRKNGKSVHAISRPTLDKDGFQMLSFSDKDGTSFKDVRVVVLIGKQRNEATRVLSEVIGLLEEEDRMHKEQFREIKLSDSYSQVLYAFEKISEDLRGGQLAMGTWGTEQLQRSLEEFESLLHARGLNLETYDPIKYRYDEIGYPLGQLLKFFKSEESDIANREAAMVFADALRGHFSELMDMAKEIDRDYEGGPSS